MQVLEKIGAVAGLRDGVDTLLGADWGALDSVSVLAAAEEIERQRRRLDAAAVLLDTAIEERRLIGDLPDCTLTDLLYTRLHLDAREARQRATRQEDLGARRTLQGEPLPPLLPSTAAALQRGEISAAHVDVIGKYVEKVDRLRDTTPATLEVVEELLVTASCHDAPRLVARLAETLLTRLDPDGSEPRERALEHARGLTLVPDADGSSMPKGRFTPELTAMLGAVLDAMSAPTNGEDGGADTRNPAQRRHDGLLEGLTRLLRGQLSPAGGTTVTTLVKLPIGQLLPGGTDPEDLEWRSTVPDEVRQAITATLRDALAAQHDQCTEGGHDLDGAAGVAFTATGGLLSLSWLHRNSCEMAVATAITDDHGAILAFGRTERLATKKQRLALAARDGGCCFPGCTRPPSWCEAHHIVPWQSGGCTDLDNLCLLCPYHHRHFERLRWRVQMINGIPMWIPPAWIDPQQRPRRNTVRHLEDITFATTTSASHA